MTEDVAQPLRMPNGLGSVRATLKRYEKARGRSTLWHPYLRQCYEYFAPQRENFYFKSEAHKTGVTLYDPTGMVAMLRGASRLQAEVTPIGRHWRLFELGPSVNKQDPDAAPIKEILDTARHQFFTALAQTNFDVEIPVAYLDLFIGTMAIDVYENPSMTGPPAIFRTLPIGEVHMEPGPFGRVETSFRLHKPVARNVERLYPDAILTDDLKKLKKDKPDKTVDLIEGVMFNPKNEHFYVVVIHRQEKNGRLIALRDEGLRSPRSIVRWGTLGQEVFGRGPAMLMLPSMQSANMAVKLLLQNAALDAAGVYTAKSTDAFNPWTVTIAPGAMIPVESNSRDNPDVRPLERPGTFDLGQLSLELLHTNIKRALFNDLRDPTQPVKTATYEHLEDTALQVESSSAFGRLETEGINPLVLRTLDILQRRGEVEQFEIDGKFITMRSTSPISRAQDQADLRQLDGAIARSALLGPEAQALGLKVENMSRYIGEKSGLPVELIRDKDDAEALQNAIAEMLANRMAAAEAGEAQAGAA